MATINPYAGDVIEFPAGTPASVISAYYNSVIRNQQIKAAQTPWWQEGIHGFTEDVFNPYIKQVIDQPFTDYRDTFSTNNRIRQANEIGAGVMDREQEMLRFNDSRRNAELGDLGMAAGQWADIANTPGPSTNVETTTGGGVNPYGAYDDPWSTGIYTPEDQMERAPTSKSVVDENGNVTEEERIPQDISAPLDSGKSNLFTTTPGKKPSSAEIIAQMAAKYPTINIGRLLEAMGKNKPMTDMLDVNKVEAQQAEIAKKEQAVAKSEADIARDRRKLDIQAADNESKAGLRTAQGEKAGADVERIRAVAQTERGRQTIRQYIMDHPELDDETVQKYLAILQDAQVRETPDQARERSDSAANIRASAPPKPRSASETELAKKRWLALESRKGTLEPNEEAERAALEKIYGKQEDPMKAFVRDTLSGGKPTGAPQQAPAEKTATPPPGVPKNYRQAVTKDGRNVWVDPSNYDKTKYTLR